MKVGAGSPRTMGWPRGHQLGSWLPSQVTALPATLLSSSASSCHPGSSGLGSLTRCSPEWDSADTICGRWGCWGEGPSHLFLLPTDQLRLMPKELSLIHDILWLYGSQWRIWASNCIISMSPVSLLAPGGASQHVLFVAGVGKRWGDAKTPW